MGYIVYFYNLSQDVLLYKMFEREKNLEQNNEKMSKVKNREHAPHLEISEVRVVHCHLVNNKYHYDSKVF